MSCQICFSSRTESEVDDFGFSILVYKNVFGLEVSVTDTLAMNVTYSVGYLTEYLLGR